MSNYKNQFKDPIGIYISIEEAARYSHLPALKFIHMIQKECIIPRDPVDLSNLGELKRPQIQQLSKQIFLPLYILPKPAIINYIKDTYVKENLISIDFLGFKEKYKSIDNLYNDIEVMKKIENSAKYFYAGDGSKEKLFLESSFSRSSYFNDKKQIMSSDLKKLLNLNPAREFRTICPCARDYLRGRLCAQEIDSTELFEDLTREKEIKGTSICEHCIHNPKSNMYQHGLNDRASYYPNIPEEICMVPGNGMIIPNSRTTVHDFAKSLSPSLLYYARYGRKNWMKHFAYKAIRIKPQKVNEIAFGDHHEVDVLLITGYKNNGDPIFKKPYITAMIDAATNAITGSVVSFKPNQTTIAECFCRAVTISSDSPFYGLPEVFYTDNGTDYCSKFIEGIDRESKTRVATDRFNERAFISEPLLVALNVTAKHAKPSYPWVKPIETIFKILDRKWFRRLPGYIGGDKRSLHNIINSKEFHRLKERNAFWDLEKFSEYWFNYVVPCYNNKKYRRSKSPLEKYLSYPRANTLTPDWATLSILKTPMAEYTVRQQGISYHGRFYNSPILHNYIGKKVFVYNFNTEFEHSLSLFYVDKKLNINKYLCEAVPAEKLQFIEDDKMKLARELMIATEQERQVSENVVCIRRSSKLMDLDNNQYIDYSRNDKRVYSTIYAEKVDLNLEDNRISVLCPDALNAIQAQNNCINSMIKTYLSKNLIQ